MEGLRGELRRLGIATGQENRSMAVAEEKARDDYQEPRVPVIARKVVVTTTKAQEDRLRSNLAIIAEAFRNGIISEDKARELVSNL